MPRVVALDLPAPSVPDALLEVWSHGDAAFVIDRRLAPAARTSVTAAAGCSVLRDPSGEQALDGGWPCGPDDAVVVATSGTTGRPRAAVLTHAGLEASAVATSTRLGVASDDRWLACLPLAHVGGLAVVCRALITRTPLTVHDGFDAARVMAAAASGCTLTALVATALRRIDATAFRAILLGGASPPADRPANAVTTYGMTETGSGIVYDGVPLDGVDVRLAADGEIHVRGPMLLRAYRDGTDPKDGDGWLATGDLGAWDAHGRLQVHGRRGDLIITGGENVWPDAVEPLLALVPGVADVAVAGVPDEEWGQRVVAFVVPAEAARPPTLEDLRAAVRSALAAHAAPKQLVVVDALPRTALGKVQRALLVHRLVGGSSDADRYGAAAARTRTR